MARPQGACGRNAAAVRLASARGGGASLSDRLARRTAELLERRGWCGKKRDCKLRASRHLTSAQSELSCPTRGSWRPTEGGRRSTYWRGLGGRSPPRNKNRFKV